MSQHDFEIANQGFPSFRSDLNSGLQALASNSAGATEPSTTYSYQFWYDSTANILKMRNADDDAWITLAFFDQTNDEWEVRSAVIQAVDSAGVEIKTDDGTARITVNDNGTVDFANNIDVTGTVTADGLTVEGSTAPTINIKSTDGTVIADDVVGAITFEESDATGGTGVQAFIKAIANDSGNTYDMSFGVGGNTEAIRIDQSSNVGIGTSSPAEKLHLNSSTNACFIQLDNTNSTQENYIGSRDSVLEFYTNGSEHMRLDSSGNLRFNSGFGSVATAYGCRAWVNFDGTGTVAIREDGNVSSITDQGVGTYDANFTTSMPDTEYCVVCNTQGPGGADFGVGTIRDSLTSAARLFIREKDGSTSDSEIVCIAVFR